jgi:hypothetical protein
MPLLSALKTCDHPRIQAQRTARCQSIAAAVLNRRGMKAFNACRGGHGIDRETGWTPHLSTGLTRMKHTFQVGDHVSWNSEAGRVRGTIRRVHVRDSVRAGYTRHASKAEPQYEIASDTTDHVAFHKGSALRRLTKSLARKKP